MSHVAIAAVGADRPGIVAAVTKVLVEHDCNLEDTSMTILRGHFAMMLIVAAPDTLDPTQLEAALAEPAERFHLMVAVRVIEELPSASASPKGADSDRWIVSVYGADHPGIVHEISTLLASQGVNIVDLSTRVIGDAERPVYAMVLDVLLPPGADPSALGEELDALARDLGVECSLHRDEADIL